MSGSCASFLHAVSVSAVSVFSALAASGKIRLCIQNLAIAHEVPEPGSTVSVSLGVATLAPRFDIAPTYLVELADRGSYLAKQNGRNQVGIAQAG
jgi:two-component system chemotaxis family response regulator WspR